MSLDPKQTMVFYLDILRLSFLVSFYTVYIILSLPKKDDPRQAWTRTRIYESLFERTYARRYWDVNLPCYFSYDEAEVQSA